MDIGKVLKSKYVEEFENLLNLEEWNKLRDEWFFIYLIKGGEYSEVFKLLSELFCEVLERVLLVYCLFYVFEMFVFVLEFGVYIFLYYGILNCKFIVYIFLKVIKYVLLKVGDEIFKWENE